MKHANEPLRDFHGPGSPGPWIAAAALFAASLAYTGHWTPWHSWLSLALGSHAIARGLLSACAGRLERPSTFNVSLAIAAAACIAGGLLAAGLVRGLDDSWPQPWRRWALDAAFGIGFAGFTILPVLVIRRAEARRHAATAQAHALALQRESDRKHNVEMELKALQAQIEPHFLYNTLANVQHLIARDPSAADRMLASLIAYLKSSMPDMRARTTTVDEELARVRAYLAIMQVRMQARLSYHIAVSDRARAQALPPMSILTLVENAVKHGLDPRPEGGCLHVLGEVRNGVLELAVMDDGVGFRSDAGGGIGLANLRSRLHALHGDAADLLLVQAANGGIEATLRLPVAA